MHTNRMPSGINDEAMMDIDLCMNYMEIVDKALVDEIPKIFIMMLVMRTIDFLKGGMFTLHTKTCIDNQLNQ